MKRKRKANKGFKWLLKKVKVATPKWLYLRNVYVVCSAAFVKTEAILLFFALHNAPAPNHPSYYLPECNKN
jgi:hypothetical protein